VLKYLHPFRGFRVARDADKIVGRERKIETMYIHNQELLPVQYILRMIAINVGAWKRAVKFISSTIKSLGMTGFQLVDSRLTFGENLGCTS
jgi:hypothetical protein